MMVKKYAVIRLDKDPRIKFEPNLPNHFKLISMFPETFTNYSDAEKFILGGDGDVIFSIIEVYIKI